MQVGLGWLTVDYNQDQASRLILIIIPIYRECIFMQYQLKKMGHMVPPLLQYFQSRDRTVIIIGLKPLFSACYTLI